VATTAPAVVAGALSSAIGKKPTPGASGEVRGTTSIRSVPASNLPTLHAHGQPFLIVGAQADIWRSVKQDEAVDFFFKQYAKMNATAVCIGIPWARCEPEEGKYDFSFLDWYIEKANHYGLKINLGLFNTNVCGKVQEGSSWELPDSDKILRYVPKWMAVDQKDKYPRINIEKWGMQCCVGGPPMCYNSKETLAKEKAYVLRLAEHLREYDVNRTICMLQINNEMYFLQVRLRPAAFPAKF